MEDSDCSARRADGPTDGVAMGFEAKRRFDGGFWVNPLDPGLFCLFFFPNLIANSAFLPEPLSCWGFIPMTGPLLPP